MSSSPPTDENNIHNNINNSNSNDNSGDIHHQQQPFHQVELLREDGNVDEQQQQQQSSSSSGSAVVTSHQHYPRMPHFGAIVNWNDLQRELSHMIQQQYASSSSTVPLPPTSSSSSNELLPSSSSSMLHHNIHHQSHHSHHHQHHHHMNQQHSEQQQHHQDGLNFVDMTQQQQLGGEANANHHPSLSSSSTTSAAADVTSTAQHQQSQPQAQLTQEQILLQQQLEELQSASFGERLGFASNQELINFLFRALPLILFPCFLFLYFHFIGVLTFLWLLLAIFTVHERLKQQVGLKENRSIWMLSLLILICVAHISLLYFFLNQYKPWWFLIFKDVAASERRDFWDSIFFVVITDCVLKLGSMAIKSFVVILIGSLPFIKATVKGRLYANIETLFYSYRCCLPAAVWIRYIWNPNTYHIAFSIFITVIYSGFKLRSILDALWKSFCALRILFSSSAPFGRYATREEVLEADDTCSICQDEFVRPIALDCSHMFCEECITAWFAQENTCPICRAKQEDIKLKFTDGSSNLGIFCL